MVGRDFPRAQRHKNKKIVPLPKTNKTIINLLQVLSASSKSKSPAATRLCGARHTIISSLSLAAFFSLSKIVTPHGVASEPILCDIESAGSRGKKRIRTIQGKCNEYKRKLGHKLRLAQ